MDPEEGSTLHSPRLWAEYWDGYVTVPEGALYRAIDALRAHIAQWGLWDGDEEASAASRAQVADAARALADLMKAMANRAREGGVRELVRQIADFMSDPDARAYLDALRERLQREKALERLEKYTHLDHVIGAESGMRVSEMADALDILDALIALHETRQRRKESRGEHPEEGDHATRS
jgi:hypothetical protein